MRRIPQVSLAACTVLAVIVGCGQGASQRDARTAATYEMRGLVRQVPVAGSAARQLLIHHEALPELVDADGERVGMGVMTMPFPVADPALLEGVEPGDRIAFTLEVDWELNPVYRILRLEELPSGARLAFEAGSAEGSPEESVADGG